MSTEVKVVSRLVESFRYPTPKKFNNTRKKELIKETMQTFYVIKGTNIGKCKSPTDGAVKVVYRGVVLRPTLATLFHRVYFVLFAPVHC